MPTKQNTRRRRLTIAAVEQALRASAGFMTVTAARLGVSRATLYRFFDKHPSLREIAEDVAEELCDLAETKLIQLIREGDGPSIRFYLETKGKNRGYTRRVENTGTDGGAIEHRITADERNAKFRNLSTDDLRMIVEALQEGKELERCGSIVRH